MTQYLDISTAVSAEDHARVLRSLLTQFENWRQESDWCTELYNYVGVLTECYRWDANAYGRYGPHTYGYMHLVTTDLTTDEDRARDLREMRGRILGFTVTHSRSINLDRANRFLTTAGLAPGTSGGMKTRMYVSVGGCIYTELTEQQVRARLRKRFVSLGGAGNRAEIYVNTESSSTQPIGIVPRLSTIRRYIP